MYWQGKNSKALLLFIPGRAGQFHLQPTDRDHRAEMSKMLKSLTDPALTRGQVDVVLLDSPWPLSPNSLAPNAKLRALVVPQGPAHEQHAAETAVAECEVEHAQARPVWISWARLLKRVFDIDMQHCANCGGAELKIIAAILERPVIEKILTHLGLAPQPPPKGRARARRGRTSLPEPRPPSNTYRHRPDCHPAAGVALRAVAAQRCRRQGQP